MTPRDLFETACAQIDLWRVRLENARLMRDFPPRGRRRWLGPALLLLAAAVTLIVVRKPAHREHIFISDRFDAGRTPSGFRPQGGILGKACEAEAKRNGGVVPSGRHTVMGISFSCDGPP